MKQKNNLEKEQLEALAARYFDGLTSVDEERELMSRLADRKLHGAAADEARFAMGLLSVGGDVQRRRRGTVALRRTMAAAASLVVLVAVAAALLLGNGTGWNDRDGQCIAYVNGKKVSDDQAVMALVTGDLRNVDDASDAVSGSVEQQLGSLGSAIEQDK